MARSAIITNKVTAGRKGPPKTKESMIGDRSDERNKNNDGILQPGEQELCQPLLLDDFSGVNNDDNDDEEEQQHARRNLPCRHHPDETNTTVSLSQPTLQSSSSFIAQFVKTQGPPQITFLMILIAIGVGSTIGVVPEVMTDRFARINHGYNGTAGCSSFDDDDGNGNGNIHKLLPNECSLGSADAQDAVALSSLISNGLTFLTSSMTGSLSDEHGRRGNYIL